MPVEIRYFTYLPEIPRARFHWASGLRALDSGGGPTDVEFSAELYHSDIARHYPALAKLSKITIYDVAPNTLGTFDQSLRKYTIFALLLSRPQLREGINILTSHHVERVEAVRLIFS